MFLNKVADKVLLASLLVLSSTSYAGFTYDKVWTIPDTQLCDNWDSVAARVQAAGMMLPGESQKITTPVPEGAVSVHISAKSAASKPSIEYTLSDYNAVCRSVDASLCPTDQIPVVNNGSGGDTLIPQLGSNTEKFIILNPEDSNVFIYQLSMGTKENLGDSSLYAASVSFKLTEAACAKRAGVELPEDRVDQQNFSNIDVQDGFAPVILTPELKLHLNQMHFAGVTYAAELKVVTDEDGVPYKDDGKIFFSMKLSEVYSVNGINEDHDDDGISIADGDCNDNDALTHPDAEDAARDCSITLNQ